MSINPKVRRALSRMVNPTKSKTANVPTKGGGKYQYSYETLADVVEIVTSALEAEGVAMHQHVTVLDGKPYMALELFDDEESIIYDMRPWKEMPDIQAQGSWETYTRRYQLKTAFNLVGEDDDGQAAMPKPKPQPKPEVDTYGHDYSKLTELCERSASATGMTVDEAKQAFVSTYGNPKHMNEAKYRAVLLAFESNIESLEGSSVIAQ